MTKTMRLMALGLSVVVFTGCSAVEDLVDEYVDDKEEEYQEEYQEQQDEVLNIPSVAMGNIIGTWSVGCVNDGDGWSESDTVILGANGTGSFAGAEYDAPGCNPANEVESWSGTFTYAIGEATTGAGGEDAVEMDLVVSEDGNSMNYYTMLHFTSANTFLMADDGDEDSDANTPETRENIFEGEENWVYTRQ